MGHDLDHIRVNNNNNTWKHVVRRLDGGVFLFLVTVSRGDEKVGPHKNLVGACAFL